MPKNTKPDPKAAGKGKPAASKPISSTPVRNSPIPKAAKAPAAAPAPKAAASTPAKPAATPATSPAPASKAAPTHDQIAKRAYEIHLSGGGGSETDNWHRAERELRGH